MNDAPPPYPGPTDKMGGPPPPNPAYPQQAGSYAPYPQQPPAPANYSTPANYGYGTQGQTTVVMQQPLYPVIQHYRETPIRVKCQFCQADIVTSTSMETGTMTWVACFILFMVGCSLGCCLIPFCMDSAKDVIHQCPSCHQQVGRYNRM